MSNLGVVQIIDSLETGGAEVLAVNIANGLNEIGLNSHICATRKEGKLIENINNKANYIFLDRKKTVDIKALMKLKRYVNMNNISVIHAHATSIFMAFCIKVINPKLKVIWHDHYGKSENLNYRSSIFLKLFSFFTHSIISVNVKLKDWSEKKLYCKNVFFVNNFASFNLVKEKTKLNGENGKRIIHLAAFRNQKNHQFLIEAFAKLNKDKPDWTLHLVGRLGNDLYTQKNLALIKELNLEKHIFVYDAKMDIKNILLQSDIGVLSSSSEGLPLALLEYGLAKLPVVCTNVGQCSDVVIDKKTGYLIESNNMNQLVDKLELLIESETDRIKFGQNNEINIKKNYSIGPFLKKIIKIYNS